MSPLKFKIKLAELEKRLELLEKLVQDLTNPTPGGADNGGKRKYQRRNHPQSD